MGTLTQYRPAYFGGFENETFTFNSIEELLNLEWVSNFTKPKNFYRFSIEKNEDSNFLMAEYSEGYSWYVVGMTNNNEIINELPLWKPKYRNNENKT